MAKILQIKRGTTAQNETIIGMPGEITMDTDTNTVRVHDGATTGGHEIARADFTNVSTSMIESKLVELGIISGETPFDINNVSPEFWTNLFKAHDKITPMQFIISDGRGNLQGAENLRAIIGAFNCTEKIDLTDIVTDCVLFCKDSDAGYDIDDLVQNFGIGTRQSPKLTISDFNGFSVMTKLWINYEPIWVPHKSTGVQTNIDGSKWSVKFRTWYYSSNGTLANGYVF